jgi:hypothetical protein
MTPFIWPFLRRERNGMEKSYVSEVETRARHVPILSTFTPRNEECFFAMHGEIICCGLVSRHLSFADYSSAPLQTFIY